MGLTWIDHETIDKPIEQITSELSVAAGETTAIQLDAEGIEIHVETLKKAAADSEASSRASRKESGLLSKVHRLDISKPFSSHLSIPLVITKTRW